MKFLNIRSIYFFPIIKKYKRSFFFFSFKRKKCIIVGGIGIMIRIRDHTYKRDKRDKQLE